MTSTQLPCGSVIIPAHNEASVITRSLAPLSSAAGSGLLDVIVVCNGCTDNTAELARSIDGVRVIEIEQASKTAALNVGDEAATAWPRLYLDADISVTTTGILDVLARLRLGDIQAARPIAHFTTDGASPLVRSYYRARSRITAFDSVLWGAGSYAMTQTGHERFDRFPSVIGDDLFVDAQFEYNEKLVVSTEPVVVRTPRHAKDLLAILRRANIGKNITPIDSQSPTGTSPSNSTRTTALQLARSVRGPLALADAAVYASFALKARLPKRTTGDTGWARDNSSRD